jgi:hypothetical protein
MITTWYVYVYCFILSMLLGYPFMTQSEEALIEFDLYENKCSKTAYLN